MKETSKAWAIKTHIPGHKTPCFLGVYYFHTGLELHPYQDGMRTALFRTRKSARKAKDELFWKKECKVVPVMTTIKD